MTPRRSVFLPSQRRHEICKPSKMSKTAERYPILYRTSFASEVEHAAKRSGANARVPFG